MAKRSGSSNRWIARQRRDPYARRAADDGLGSRAHFKLAQLDQRFKLVRQGSRVLELGAAPGGWTKYLADKVDPSRGGLVVAVDVREMSAPAGVRVLREDIESDAFLTRVAEEVGAGLDLVLSDMAPNISAVRSADQAASMHLVELATDAALRWLKPGGNLVVKMFQGEGVDDWVRARRKDYGKAQLAKPDASRSGSREIYGLALRRQ